MKKDFRDEFKKRGKKYKAKYLAALDRLYGDGLNERKGTVVQLSILDSKGSSRKVDNGPTELYEQIRLCVWLDKAGIRYYAIPNGGWRSPGEAVKLKRSGVKPGVPDICIPIPVAPYHGLYIELKRVKGGKVSESQEEWLGFLRSQGYKALVSKGFDEAKRDVEYYLSHPKSA